MARKAVAPTRRDPLGIARNPELLRGAIARYAEDIVAFADDLADQVAAGKLKSTREAAACLRRARLSTIGTPSMASSTALEQVITTAIDTYLAEHPDATTALVREALCRVAEKKLPG